MKKFLYLFIAIMAVTLVGCSNKSTNLSINDVAKNYSGYTCGTYSYNNGDSGMIGELEAYTINEESETDDYKQYILAYFFNSQEEAQTYLDKNSTTLQNKQSSLLTGGTDVSFGRYLNVVYISTSEALTLLKK